jgi:hypothetical protein
MFIFQLAQEAYACEEKEEKLVTDAVKHLTEANYQIKDLYDQFTVKVNYDTLSFPSISTTVLAVLEILHIGLLNKFTFYMCIIGLIL